MSSGQPPNSNGGDSSSPEGNHPSSNGTQGTNTPGNGRDFTVSIQYSYIPLVSLGNGNVQIPGANAAGTTHGQPAPQSAAGTVDPSTTNSAGTTSTTPGNGSTPATNGAAAPPPPFPMPQAADSFVLSFRDIPSSTPQSRLESIISLTAELAMRRFQEMHSRPTGIPRSEFEKLLVLTLDQVRSKNGGADVECSICYDPFVEEPKKEESGTGKRVRDEYDETTSETEPLIARVKRQRTEISEPSAERPEAATTTPAADSQNTQTTTADSQQTEEDVHYLHSPVELPCHHIFGRDCIYQWSKTKNSCPLCRHKISEAVNTESAHQFAMNPATVSEFERLRNMLYNPPPEGEEGTEENGAGEGQAPSTAQMNGRITFNAPNIIFLTPEALANRATAAQTAPAAPPAPANTSANSGTASAVDVPGTTTPTTTQSPANVPVANRPARSITLGFPTTGGAQPGINWVPLPARYINAFNNDARTTSNPGPNGIPNTGSQTTTPVTATTATASTAATNAASQDNTTAEGTRYERLRSMLRGIFDAAEREDPAESNSHTTAAPAPGTSDTTQSDTGSTRRPNPEILRHANNIREALLRNAANGAHMFGSGVASYRDSNGNVVTSELPGYGATGPANSTSNSNTTSQGNSSSSPTQEPSTANESADAPTNDNHNESPEDNADNSTTNNDPAT